jgi:hypothetical protein
MLIFAFVNGGDPRDVPDAARISEAVMQLMQPWLLGASYVRKSHQLALCPMAFLGVPDGFFRVKSGFLRVSDGENT